MPGLCVYNELPPRRLVRQSFPVVQDFRFPVADDRGIDLVKTLVPPSSAREKQSGKIQATLVAIHLGLGNNRRFCFRLNLDFYASLRRSRVLRDHRTAGLNFLFVH